MSGKLTGQRQIKRRRQIVDTLNGTDQNLNMMVAIATDQIQPIDGSGGGGSYTPPDTGGGTGGNTGSTGSTQTPTASSGGSCPNPGTAYLTETGNASGGAGSTRTQIFAVGSAVNPGFNYSVGVYSVSLNVTAVDGDTPDTIAQKLAAAINNTPLSTWNQYGSNNNNYKPTATASGGMLTTHCDYQHQFAAYGSGSCTAAPPPPPADPAFPYDQFQIDAMDCQTITANLNSIMQTQQQNNYQSWNSMISYMQQRQTTACAAPPPSEPTQEPSFPYTDDQVNGMDCAMLQTTLVALQQQIHDHGYTTWGDKLKAMQDRATSVCAVPQTPDTTPQLQAPKVVPFPIYSPVVAGGGGSGSSSVKPVQPVKTTTYLWVAIGVGSAIAYFTFGGGSIVKV